MVGIRRAFLAGLFLYVLLMALGSLFWPMGRDQGIFAWVGDVIADGGVPYRDAWEVKGPATHYTFALTQLLLGRNLWGIRLMDLAMLTVTVVVLWRLVRRLAGPFAAHMAAVLLPLYYYRDGYWGTAQPDGWASMLLLIALAIMLSGRQTRPAIRIAAGALVGLAASYKFLFVGFLVPLVLCDVLAADGSWRARLSRSIWLFVGCAAAAFLLLIPLVLQGAWADFCDIQFDFNRVVHQQTRPRPVFQHAAAIAGVFSGRIFFDSLILFAFGLGIIRLRKSPVALTTLLTFFLLALLCVAVQGKYYWYHWRPMSVPVVILAAIGIAGLREMLLESPQLPRKIAQAAEIGILATVGWFLCLSGPGINRAGWKACVLGTLPRDSYYGEFAAAEAGGYPLPAIAQAADYLHRQTGEDDYVQVWGFESLINVLCQRKSPTRFGFNYPMIVAPDSEFGRRYRREFLAEIGSRPPRYIVIVDHDTNDLMPKTSKQYLAEFPEFARYVRKTYNLERTIGYFELWRRKGP